MYKIKSKCQHLLSHLTFLCKKYNKLVNSGINWPRNKGSCKLLTFWSDLVLPDYPIIYILYYYSDWPKKKRKKKFLKLRTLMNLIWCRVPFFKGERKGGLYIYICTKSESTPYRKQKSIINFIQFLLIVQYPCLPQGNN